MKQKAKKMYKQVKAFFPEDLPQSPKQFEDWATDILEIAGLPDNESFRHALAAQLMHVPERVTAVPKRFFIKTLIKAIVNQNAFNVMQDLKERAKHEKTVEAADAAMV